LPAVYLDKIYAGGMVYIDFLGQNGLFEFNKNTGTEIKRVEWGRYTSINAGHGFVYTEFERYTSSGGLYALDTADLSVKWAIPFDGPYFNGDAWGPHIVDSSLIVYTPGVISFYDAYSGKLSWQRKSNARGATYVDGIIYSSSKSNAIYYDSQVIVAFDKAKNAIKWVYPEFHDDHTRMFTVVTKSGKMFYNSLF
jgi:outer membrane protein assembly factor BamB